MSIEKDKQKAKQIVFDYFGDNEVWVNVTDGNIFNTSIEGTFTKDNFETFLFDKHTRYAALRPAIGMHKRMHNPMEHMINSHYTKELYAKGKLALYRLQFDQGSPSGSDSGASGIDEEEDQCCPMELIGHVTKEEFLQDYPEAFSLV